MMYFYLEELEKKADFSCWELHEMLGTEKLQFSPDLYHLWLQPANPFVLLKKKKKSSLTLINK